MGPRAGLGSLSFARIRIPGRSASSLNGLDDPESESRRTKIKIFFIHKLLQTREPFEQPPQALQQLTTACYRLQLRVETLWLFRSHFPN